MTKKTLEELRQEIQKEVPYVGRKPFSHNIIGLLLGAIHEKYGTQEANKAVLDFRLDKKGWKVLTEQEVQ